MAREPDDHVHITHGRTPAELEHSSARAAHRSPGAARGPCCDMLDPQRNGRKCACWPALKPLSWRCTCVAVGTGRRKASPSTRATRSAGKRRRPRSGPCRAGQPALQLGSVPLTAAQYAPARQHPLRPGPAALRPQREVQDPPPLRACPLHDEARRAHGVSSAQVLATRSRMRLGASIRPLLRGMRSLSLSKRCNAWRVSSRPVNAHRWPGST